MVITGFDATTTIPFLQAVFSGNWNKINTTETYPVGRVWDVERGEEIATFRDCRSASFLPDNSTLAVLHTDNSIRFYPISPRRPLGLILAMTTGTWGLILLLVWAMKRRFRRRREVSPAVSLAPAVPTGTVTTPS